ncbi:hypothetical protein [Streptomyces sp. TP-A0875]|uniref:hypothetical protein n=1 Tax=Streptomyces sp. TP-A0875 TaxID=552354 RepID=UPI0006B52677|nr:hypothetical protein [Streptomyces sp. TP-A0875]
MATTNPTDTDERTTRVHQLAARRLSHRAIGRELGIAHTTVGRILRTTPAPVERTEDAPPAPVERTTPTPVDQAERTTSAPPTPTSGNPRAPRLLHPLDPRTIQDLNCLMDPRTGALPAPLVRLLRSAADARRTSMRATAHRIANEG